MFWERNLLGGWRSNTGTKAIESCYVYLIFNLRSGKVIKRSKNETLFSLNSQATIKIKSEVIEFLFQLFQLSFSIISN